MSLTLSFIIMVFVLIGGAFIKLAAKIVIKENVSLGSSSVVSFVSCLFALLSMNVLGDKLAHGNVYTFLPSIIYFVSCWLLTIQFVKYGEESESLSYGQGFLIILIQSFAFIITGIISLILFLLAVSLRSTGQSNF